MVMFKFLSNSLNESLYQNYRVVLTRRLSELVSTLSSGSASADYESEIESIVGDAFKLTDKEEGSD